MTARPFLAPLAVFAVGLVALNLAIEPAAAHSQPRVLFDEIGNASGVTDLFLGSSLVAQSIDAHAWDAARPGARALNTGFNATFSTEHDILLRRARHLLPARVYYGFSDLDLSKSAADTNVWISGNAAVFDALDPDTAIHFRATGGLFDRWRMRLNSTVPLLKNRFSPWGRVEKLRRRLATLGWPHPEPDPEFEPLDDAAFAREVAAAADRSEPLSGPILDLLNVASDAKATIYVVQMPATTRHRQRFFATPEWQRYRAAIESRLRALNVTFVDASDWARDEEFHDTIHLGPAGAQKFTKRLEQAIHK